VPCKLREIYADGVLLMAIRIKVGGVGKFLIKKKRPCAVFFFGKTPFIFLVFVKKWE